MTRGKIVGGLDPSLSNFGMSKGLLRNGELEVTDIMLVTTKEDTTIKYKNMRDIKRARQLLLAMQMFFDRVDTVYVEVPVGSQSSRAMASYGICIGILALLGKRLIRVSAKDVKVAATGNPEASKADMIEWATNLYPDLPWLTKQRKGESSFTNANEHVADSIASIKAGLLNANLINI